MEDNNIVQLIKGGKEDEQTLPFYEYVIVDRTGREFYHDGFLLFTSQHVAIMQDRGQHTVPVFLLPLSELSFLEIIDDDEIVDDFVA